MTQEQLHEWLREHNLPDEWWLSIAGETRPDTMTLAAAVAAANGQAVQVCHVSRADASEWWPVETVSARQIQVPTKGTICTQCGHVGKPKTHVKGSLLVELVLWLCFLLPGLIYSVWRSTSASRQKVCRECGSTSLVPLKTPGGKQAYLRYHG